VVAVGASGIGHACVDALLAGGARVAVADRDPEGAAVIDAVRREGKPPRSSKPTSPSKPR
jgi:NAD(P)-dependent dehydrogenase (short-subunit alcohol dehydrogenase family)